MNDWIWITATFIVLGVGGTAAFIRRSRAIHREAIEDALKHLYNCEYTNVSCTLESLAGALGRRRSMVTEVADTLTARGLASLKGSELVLSPAGRDYALKVIRVHRLWERYLADETTVSETDWHKQAEVKEHSLDQKEATELSRRLGHPVYDPHGDPIPSPEGAIPAVQGDPLETFKDRSVVTIIHVEDEPPSTFERLVQAGMYAGMKIRILSRTSEKIAVEHEGKLIELPLVAAANIRAILTARDKDTGSKRTLASLQSGEQAIVSGISNKCRGMQRRRLMDLGVVPGTSIGCVMSSAAGDPIAYRIRGATIALRKEQAEMVFLQ